MPVRLADAQRALRLNIFEVMTQGFPQNNSGHDENLKGYKTLSALNPYTENTKPVEMYAIDCEMVKTQNKNGMIMFELARVSVVDCNLNVTLDELVKPENTIVDYLTQYSGISAKIMENVTTTLEDIQEEFMTRFDQSTIFVGHSLEQDLKALKLIHSNVIDTAVLYCRKFGGLKPKLKLLSAMHLNMLIQTDTKGGHNSLEDARAAMCLCLKDILPPIHFERLLSNKGQLTDNFFKVTKSFYRLKFFLRDIICSGLIQEYTILNNL
eukprot:UN33431